MGKLVTVVQPFMQVTLPPYNLPFNAGQSTIVTEAEYSALNPATLRTVTVTTSGLADPVRTGTNPPISLSDAVAQANSYTNTQIPLGGRARTQPTFLAEYMTEKLRALVNWALNNGIPNNRLFIGEIGWPSETFRPGEGVAWNDLHAPLFTMADDLGIGVSYYNASKSNIGKLRAYGASGQVVFGGLGGTLDTKYSQAALVEAHLGASNRGIALGDNDNGGPNVRVNAAATSFSLGSAGTLGVDYAYNTLADFQYLAAQGHKLIRFPIRIERLITGAFSSLIASELTALTTAINQAGLAGLQVIIDIHNFGQVGVSGTVGSINGSGGLSKNAFIDMWTKLSTAFKSNNTVIGYGIMNEPWASNSYSNYSDYIQGVITGIRGNSDTKIIVVPTLNYTTGAANPYTDPSNNLWHEAHFYADDTGVFGSTMTALETAKNPNLTFPATPDPRLVNVVNPISGVEETVHRAYGGSQTTAPVSGTLYLMYFTAEYSHTVSTIYTKSRSTAASGLTYASLGLFSVASDDSITLLSSTATDNTLLTSSFTNYTRALQASQTLTAGTRYAIGILLIGTTMPTMYAGLPPVDGDVTPKLLGSVAAQASMPASVIASSITAAAAGPIYAKLY